MRALASGIAAVSLLAAPALAQDTTQDMTVNENEDPHLWLEEVEGERAIAQVREWNARTLAELEADPLYQALYAEMLEIVNSQDRIPAPGQRGGHLYNFWQDETHVRGLWRRTTQDSYLGERPEWDVLLDLDALAEREDRNWVYAGVSCAPPDWNSCLVSLSDGGSDAAIRREFDIETRAFPAEGFEIPIAKSGSAWADRDTLLLTTDWGAAEPGGSLTESGYPFIVKRLARGQTLDEAEEIFRGAPEDVGVWPAAIHEPDGRRFVYFTRAVTFYESEYWLEGADGALLRLPLPLRSSVQEILHGWMIVSLEEDMEGAEGGFLSGDLIALDLDSVQAGAPPRVELVWRPDSRSAFQGAAASADGLIVLTTHNVQSEAHLFRREGETWTGRRLPLPENGVIGLASADRESHTAFFNVNSMLVSNALYLADLENLTAHAVKQLPEWFDASSMIVEQFEAPSSDGTLIPYFVMRPKDLPAGPAPALLYGYGGFQVSMAPSYSAGRGRLWVARGGVFVLANIRGGGEFGPAWHQAGLKTGRQIIYDDFIAVAEDLIARGITAPERLGVQGGSNGGLLTGVMYVQRPDLFGAVISQVPLLDMLRYDRLLAGASWVGEYGSPSIAEERAFLQSISPYHNVREGAAYPPVFFVTSTKDDRVHPAHARKMAMRLQEMGYDFDYYENIDGGHSAAANLIETARRTALEFAWLWRQLGGPADGMGARP